MGPVTGTSDNFSSTLAGLQARSDARTLETMAYQQHTADNSNLVKAAESATPRM